MKPHKHAEVIKAWADGAEIEWRCSGWREGLWKKADAHMTTFYNDYEYRVKPKTKSLGQVAFESTSKSVLVWDRLQKTTQDHWQNIGEAVAKHIKENPL